MSSDFISREARRPCWYCQHYGGLLANGINARCNKPGAAPVVAQPAHGCAHWTREPGGDDEIWSPLYSPPLA
ncbi:hypothetical protein [Azohydromonas aeria]|uniref:hypothetical protein n=1 Tax=Azohydromonas aeria TaxID=2590212 RepID=UPI0012FB832F|nr:hypothetical protein [Azohydromonas aeria]